LPESGHPDYGVPAARGLARVATDG
jgi:hypothetical protein